MSLNVLFGILYTYNGFSENLFPLILTFRCSSETLPLLHRNFLLCNFYDMNYSSAKWKRKREKILRMDGYIDQISRRYGRIQEATTVHHIYPVKDYPEYEWCDWNLISVSQATHNKLENRTTGELTELGMDLMRRTEIGIDWRKGRKKI